MNRLLMDDFCQKWADSARRIAAEKKKPYIEEEKGKGDHWMTMETGKKLKNSVMSVAAKVIRAEIKEEKSFPIPPCTAFLHQPKRPK